MRIQKISDDEVEIFRFGIKTSAIGETPIVETTCWRQAKGPDPRGVPIEGLGGLWIFLHATNAIFDITEVYPISKVIEKPTAIGAVQSEKTGAFGVPSGAMNVFEIPLPPTIREVETETELRNSLTNPKEHSFEIV